MPAETILVLVMGAVYLIAVYFWVTNYFKRIEPFLLNKLGDRLGLKIKRVWRNWEIRGEHTWRQGCLVMLLELGATFFILITPFWLLIGLMLAVAFGFQAVFGG